jgi:hypothetical protein
MGPQIQAKNKPKILGNIGRQDNFYFLFHKQFEPTNYLNPKTTKASRTRDNFKDENLSHNVETLTNLTSP